jgi:hypothetical protein
MQSPTRGRRWSRGLLLALALMIGPFPAAAGAANKPQKAKAPGFYTGTIRGHSIVNSVGADSTSYAEDRWQVNGLRLKHRKDVVTGSGQKQRLYKVVDGTVTWTFTHRYTGPQACGTGTGTETFSLKGVKWEGDSRVVFFAPSKGRHKNQWRMNASLYTPRETPFMCGATALTASLPSLLSGTKVGEKSPIARPGKKVRLTFASYRKIDANGSYDDSRNTMTVAPATNR